MSESFCLDSRYFRLRGCLELRSRTARTIVGHIKEDVGGSLDKTFTREDSALGFVFLECSNRGKSFSLKPSLLFYKILFDFKRSSYLIRLWW